MPRSASPTEPAIKHTNGNGHSTNGHGNGAKQTGYRQLRQGEKGTWRGLSIERRYTRAGTDPYDTVEWENREAVITNEHGKVVFEQKDLEFPKSWSQLATQVTTSKYFRGTLGTPERERSVKQMIGRVVDTITGWGEKDSYFATTDDQEAFHAELTDILLKQRAAFNSPVWFNVGIDERPQCSACFINSVQDTMDSILTLAHTEGMLFKYGSGTGSNLSTLRSKTEGLKGGGSASGPVSFMKGFDAFAGVIKSGGKTRRAAKMVILNMGHPDIEEFIDCKMKEEKKAWALIDAGYDGNFNGGEAYESVFFQNSNNSVRVTDEFMQAVEDDKDWTTTAVVSKAPMDTFKARALLAKMAEAAWVCGDPGIQYHDNINRWHTSANTAPINASNPCSEYMYLDDSACNLASLNLMKFVADDGEFDIEAYKHAVRIVLTAQEILVDNASYPTPLIEKNSHAFRPLGLGYANLGALLMNRGLAYDSDEGRAYAAAITAIMQGEAELQSARISRDQGGPFTGYAVNKEPYLRVMNQHRDAAYRLDRQLIPTDLLDAAMTTWDEVIALGTEHGFRNGQVSVLAPTGCLTGNSLVLTDRGLVRLRSLGNPDGMQWQDLDLKVATDDGARPATKFFINGAEPVVSITTGRGYRIQGTPTHRIKVVDGNGDWQWRRFADIRQGDRVPLMLGGMVGEPREVSLPPLAEAYWTSDHTTFVPRYMSADLAELVGYFMGDGSLHAKGLRFSVSAQDTDVVERLVSLGRSLFGLEAAITPKTGYIEVAFHSVRLTLWWEACGFAKRAPNAEHRGKGYESHIPDAILYTNDPVAYRAFVRGLYEADGNTNNGYAYWATVSEQFSYDVQSLLLALGFVTTRKTDLPAYGHMGANPVHYLRLLNANTAARFLDEIGFISERKGGALAATASDHPQTAKGDLVPVDRGMVDRLAPDNDHLRKTMLLSLSRTGLVTRRSATQLAERISDAELEQTLGYFYDEIASAKLGEEQLTYDLSVPANVTYVANGFVSHNTIAFLMDCDTTGVEPDIALIKYKRLVGGGYLKIVNQTVPHALKELGYTAKQTEEIVTYIDEHETIEGAPHLKDEHLSVFDCAFKPANGNRSIHYNGHLKMMAAVQPFLSGAISKTVNMPEASTPAEIAQVYIDGWKLGLKAIAVYRDNSKRSQPLNTKKEGGDAVPAGAAASVAEAPKPYRRRLPDERAAFTHKFNVAGHEGYLTVGLYEDGQPGEIFLKMAKEGSTISGLMDAFATAVSVALQYGVPLKDLVNKFSHLRFEPAGFTTNRDVPMAKSLIDYIFRYLATKFLSRDEQDVVGIINRQMTLSDAPVVSGVATADAPDSAGFATASPEAAAAASSTVEAAPSRDAVSEDVANDDASGPSTGAQLESAHEAEPTIMDGLKIVAKNGHADASFREARLEVGQAPVIFDTADSPACTDCGSIMVRNGSCYKCMNCGSTSGCS
ncbi:MAG: vitamin B12-dependent ribonucleotide reductase [Chloroflexi bacterium]|nr:vitamin B12-dependent ribonucleotide reductase [Chloroflexota bacterium]